jgi:hypothetical protein
MESVIFGKPFVEAPGIIGHTLRGSIVIEPVDRHVGAGGSEFQDHRVADPLLAPVTKTPFQRTACSSFLDPGSIETSRPISMTAVGGVGPAFFASLRARTSPPRMSAVTVMWDERTDQTIEVTLNVAADRNRRDDIRARRRAQ